MGADPTVVIPIDGQMAPLRERRWRLCHLTLLLVQIVLRGSERRALAST